MELRQRIVEAVDQQRGTMEELASLFQGHSSYIDKLLRHRRERQDLAPLPHGGGASATLEAEERRVLVAVGATQPEATLDELRQGLAQKKRVHVSLSTLWRWLTDLALTRKKRPGGPGQGIR